jgi:hypothetical protein
MIGDMYDFQVGKRKAFHHAAVESGASDFSGKARETQSR